MNRVEYDSYCVFLNDYSDNAARAARAAAFAAYEGQDADGRKVAAAAARAAQAANIGYRLFEEPVAVKVKADDVKPLADGGMVWNKDGFYVASETGAHPNHAFMTDIEIDRYTTFVRWYKPEVRRACLDAAERRRVSSSDKVESVSGRWSQAPVEPVRDIHYKNSAQRRREARAAQRQG